MLMAKDMGVEYVIESTGLFVEAEKVLFFKKIILLMAIVFAEHVHTGSPNFIFLLCVCVLLSVRKLGVCQNSRLP